MKSLKRAIVAVLVTGGLLSACAPQKIMVNNRFVPGQSKVARTTVLQVGSTDNAGLFNYYVEVCDVKNQQATNCNSSLVLENVRANFAEFRSE